MEGYEDMIGSVDYTKLFPSCNGFKMTQEFGTRPGIVVLKALINENTAFHCLPHDRLQYAQTLRDVFYESSDVKWKLAVLTRGVTVFKQVEGSL
jgi:Protein of unknown function (DUF2817)